MKLESIDIISSQSKWNSLIKSHLTSKFRNPFIGHNPSLAGIFENVFKYKSEYYLITEGDKIIGLLPGFRVKDKYISIPIFPCAGIFMNNIKSKINIYENILPTLGKYEIRDEIKFSKYYYDKKISCYLQLDDDSDLQWKEFVPKVRNQIRKGYKSGIHIKVGGIEFLEEFYRIYSTNMHYLGSPVLDKVLFSALLNEYQHGLAKIFISYFDSKPVGGSFILSFNNLFEVGWASTIREYNKYNPNMVLYWEMIKYSIENKMDFFSFGRATRGSGSHKFKQQWGVEEIPLYFNYSSPNIDIRNFHIFSKLWRQLPRAITDKFGPTIRKRLHI